MQGDAVLSLRFNTHSSARVVNEFINDSDLNYDNDDIFHLSDDIGSVLEHESEEQTQIGEGEENDFEFSFVCNEQEISPISTDEIFYKGQIRPIYPIFGSDLRLRDDRAENYSELNSRRFSLSKLMTEERDLHSCSSSEADELDHLPPETYCVWKPKREEESSSSPGKCKKSSSTGSSSKRWRFRDLLHRSNSDGKDTYVFMTPTSSLKRKTNEEKSKGVKFVGGASKATTKGVSGVSSPSAHEVHYARNRALKEGEKRRSYLPYRQDLVGFFVNVNGLDRKSHHF